VGVKRQVMGMEVLRKRRKTGEDLEDTLLKKGTNGGGGGGGGGGFGG